MAHQDLISLGSPNSSSNTLLRSEKRHWGDAFRKLPDILCPMSIRISITLHRGL